MQSGDDDDESLEAHADQDNQGNDEQSDAALSQGLDPKDLRRHNIAEDQTPVGRPIGSQHAIELDKLFEAIAAVGSHERLNEVAVSHHQAGRQNDLGHVLQMQFRDEILQTISTAQRD